MGRRAGILCPFGLPHHFDLIGTKDRCLKDYLLRFYWRRTLRIFPLYFTFLLIAAFAFTAAFKQDWPWLISYTADLARIRQTDLNVAFVHLWSLAVEEQFYLIWPLVVFLTPIDRFRQVVIAILIFSPLFRLTVYGVFHDAPPEWIGRTIYGLPLSQIDAFAAGAFLVVNKINNPTRWFALSGVVTLLAGAAVLAHQHFAYHSATKQTLGYAMFLMEDGGFVWEYSLLNIVAALGIASVIENPPAWLSSKPIVRVGVISYGIYVIHLPLWVALRSLDLPRTIAIPLLLVATYLVAELSYMFLERPFLLLKDRAISPDRSPLVLNRQPDGVA